MTLSALKEDVAQKRSDCMYALCTPTCILMASLPGFRDIATLWRPEYASYMVEGTPGKPYGHLMAHFNLVECNMKQRYCQSSLAVVRQNYEKGTKNSGRWDFCEIIIRYAVGENPSLELSKWSEIS